MLMAEIARKVETNIKDRISAITLLTDGAAKTVRVGMEHLLKLEPIQAAASILAEAGDGTAEFIKKQAEISRRLLK